MRNHNIVLFFSFNQKVDGSVIKMGKHLYEVKGSTQGQGISKAEVQAAADAILQPLMDLLDGTTNYIIEISFKRIFIIFPPFLQRFPQ